MFTKDYIMRMIEQMVRGIALIVRLKQENRVEESETVLADTLRRFFGLHERSLEELPWRQLMAVASLGSLPDGERSALLAQLIGEKADLLEMGGEAGAAVLLREKAACIYLCAIVSDDSLAIPEHTGRADALAAAAGGRLHHADGLRLLFAYHDRRGRYAKAEDALFKLMESGGNGEDLERGKAFYRRLRELSDGELEAGNLPRSEVSQGLGHLLGRWGFLAEEPGGCG